MLAGDTVSSHTAGLHLTVQRNLPLLLTAWLQWLFPGTLSPLGRCHLPCPLACPCRDSTRWKDSLPPGCSDTGSARAQHIIHTREQTNLVAHLLCRWHRTAVAGAAHRSRMPRGTGLQQRTALFSLRLWKFPALVMLIAIHVAALISLDLPVIKTCKWRSF